MHTTYAAPAAAHMPHVGREATWQYRSYTTNPSSPTPLYTSSSPSTTTGVTSTRPVTDDTWWIGFNGYDSTDIIALQMYWQVRNTEIPERNSTDGSMKYQYGYMTI
jgi:hypothetical protein